MVGMGLGRGEILEKAKKVRIVSRYRLMKCDTAWLLERKRQGPRSRFGDLVEKLRFHLGLHPKNKGLCVRVAALSG